MALVDDIEFYGASVDSGAMTRQDAVKALVDASDGGLTEYGAEVRGVHCDAGQLPSGQPTPWHEPEDCTPECLRWTEGER